MRLFANFDFVIPLTVLVIGVLGLVLLWGLVPDLFLHQVIFFILGLAFFLIFSQIDFRIYENFRWLIYLIVCALLLLTLVLGGVTRGAVRWIVIGPFAVQFSEIVKPFLVLFFSFYFAREKIKVSYLLGGIFLFLVPAFLIFYQPDLGSTLVMASALLGILLASLSFSLILSGIFSLFLILPVSWFFLAAYQKERILSFLNPGLDPLGSGYNLIQAVISVGSGQFFGRGLGRGTQSQLAFLPEHHTDFIFASFTEELGFIGAIILLGLYFLLLLRILKVAQNAREGFARLFCLGIFSFLLFQVFVNVGMNLGIVPITGITLPFVSYGGSSIISLMISLGMVESIARFQKKRQTIEIR